MPIYEYRCQHCGTVFETFVISDADRDKVMCRRCGGRKVRKQVSSFSSRLSGFSGGLSGCSSKRGFS